MALNKYMEVNIMKNGVFNWLSHRKMVQRGKKGLDTKERNKKNNGIFFGRRRGSKTKQEDHSSK